MQITRSSIDTAKGPSDWFTGDVYIDSVAAAPAAVPADGEPGALHARRTHPLAPPPVEPDRVRHRRRRPLPAPRRTRRDHPPRRPRALRGRRGALARRRTQPAHGPPRHQRRRRRPRRRPLARLPSPTRSTPPPRLSTDSVPTHLTTRPHTRSTPPHARQCLRSPRRRPAAGPHCHRAARRRSQRRPHRHPVRRHLPLRHPHRQRRLGTSALPGRARPRDRRGRRRRRRRRHQAQARRPGRRRLHGELLRRVHQLPQRRRAVLPRRDGPHLRRHRPRRHHHPGRILHPRRRRRRLRPLRPRRHRPRRCCAAAVRRHHHLLAAAAMGRRPRQEGRHRRPWRAGAHGGQARPRPRRRRHGALAVAEEAGGRSPARREPLLRHVGPRHLRASLPGGSTSSSTRSARRSTSTPTWASWPSTGPWSTSALRPSR